MNIPSFLLQPEPGQIIQIYVRHRRVDFRYGFCRAIHHAGRYVQFVGGFRRREDPSMTTRWAESCDFGIQPFERFSFDLATEAEWMSLNKPPQSSP